MKLTKMYIFLGLNQTFKRKYSKVLYSKVEHTYLYVKIPITSDIGIFRFSGYSRVYQTTFIKITKLQLNTNFFSKYDHNKRIVHSDLQINCASDLCIKQTVHRTNSSLKLQKNQVRVGPKYRRTYVTLGGCNNTISKTSLTTKTISREVENPLRNSERSQHSLSQDPQLIALWRGLGIFRTCSLASTAHFQLVLPRLDQRLIGELQKKHGS